MEDEGWKLYAGKWLFFGWGRAAQGAGGVADGDSGDEGEGEPGGDAGDRGSVKRADWVQTPE